VRLSKRFLLEAFTAAIEGCEDDGVKAMLNLVCDLCALHNVESDRAFFQEHGRLASPRCKAITREVNRLCNEVRGHAAAVVGAFGIPDPVLGAPIGVADAAVVGAAER
jgi:acyl-CoA oxidase